MKTNQIFLITLLFVGCVGSYAQNRQNHAAEDNRGFSRVNPTTLGFELEIPLAKFPGRGIDIPVNLSYSSRQWRLDDERMVSEPESLPVQCRHLYSPVFAAGTSGGWTTSLDAPYLEYSGGKTFYDADGKLIPTADSTCREPGTAEVSEYSYLRRVVVHFPGDESHELRPDDSPIEFSRTSIDDPRNPNNALNWDAVYYAVDGSNLRLTQDSATQTYRLHRPDGSFYDFDPAVPALQTRTALKYTDRNGNSVAFRAPDVNNPNAVRIDTIGRTIAVPFSPEAPPNPTTSLAPQLYFIPGNPHPFKFHWKYLKGGNARESGLTDFTRPLRYRGDTVLCGNPARYCRHPETTALFADVESFIIAGELFNPVVLTRIELPGGRDYRFSYDTYGRMENVTYPGGGRETVKYGPMPVVVPANGINSPEEKANFGVIERKLYRNAADVNPFIWSYAAVETVAGYRVISNEPDGRRVERLVHKPVTGGAATLFGAGDPLAGKVVEEQVFSAENNLISKTLSTWAISGQNPLVNRHPRITAREKQIFGPDGVGISATTTYAYAGDLSQPDAQILENKSEDYDFVPVGSAIPPTPLRTTETSFIGTDPAVPDSLRSHYKTLSLGGLVSSRTIREGSGFVLTRIEQSYDEADFSSPTGHGNLTSILNWDSAKGTPDDRTAYIAIRAHYDEFGNQTKVFDQNGSSLLTEFDSETHAFPVKRTIYRAGSDTPSTTLTTFDVTRGLPRTTTEADGVESRYSYDALTWRLTKLERRQNDETLAGSLDIDYNGLQNIPAVRMRTEIAPDRWLESTVFFDGLGRTRKAVMPTSRGTLVVETENDADGRIHRFTDPYFQGTASTWIEAPERTAGESGESVSSEDRKRNGVLISDILGRPLNEPPCRQSGAIIGVLISDLLGPVSNADDCSDERLTTGVLISDLIGASALPPDCGERSGLSGVLISDFTGSSGAADGCGARGLGSGVLISDVIGKTTFIAGKSGRKRIEVTDALGRVIRRIEDPDAANDVTNFRFDAVGNLRGIWSSVKSRFFAYDSLGRVTYAKLSEQEPNPDFFYLDQVTGNRQWSISVEYDADSMRVRNSEGMNEYHNCAGVQQYGIAVPADDNRYDRARIFSSGTWGTRNYQAVPGYGPGNMSTGNFTVPWQPECQ